VEREAIGGGGFGQVHKGTIVNPDIASAFQITPFKDPIALKYFKIKDNKYKEMEMIAFKQEVALLIHFKNCPNILTVFGFVMKPPVMIMKFYPYGHIGSFALGRSEVPGCKYNPHLVVELMRDVANGLSVLHNEGVVHCDIKPMNIMMDMVDRQNIQVRAVLIDFGIARVTNERLFGVKMFRQSKLTGISYDFAAPEVLNEGMKDHVITDKIDVFSFAMVSFMILTRTLPKMCVNDRGSVPYEKQIKDGVRPVIPQKVDNIFSQPGLMQDCMSIVQRCWAASPSFRPTMSQVLTELNNLKS
jgi:serine/threonine protein kinase